ncbi:MAG: hypothetical protein ABR925_09005 [Acidimicrobiales bacterium]|jgi:phenylacetate-coenzyme A ligase PaaK-like adenylate-forming protein
MAADDYDALLACQRVEVGAGLLRHARRLRWARARIDDERQRLLRELLSHAIEHSSFHRGRLSGIDVDTFTEADLVSLPSMTKDDLMANFDEIITDPRLNREVVESHIESLKSDAYLLSEFRAFSTGGSSGGRGVFIYNWDEWITLLSIANRWLVQRASDVDRKSDFVGVSIFAAGAVHTSGAMQDFFQDDHKRDIRLSAASPIGTIVAHLNDVQPDGVMTYPSTLKALCERARSGELRIAPREIQTCGELLPPSLRADTLELWGTPIYDYWGTTEGVYAFPCQLNTDKHLPDDVVIVEAVDANGAPIVPGEVAAKMLVTRLYNKTQPLIRYEIADSVTMRTDPCPCGSAYSRIGDLRGRLSDAFTYANGAVLSFISELFDPLERHRAVIDYQVTQTANGVDVLIYSRAEPNIEALRSELIASLQSAGLDDPQVTLAVDTHIERLASGKLRRFIPLP